MALPIQSAPTFTCELPSDGTEVKFRPFLVKEQRNLLLTKEDPTPTEVMTSVKNISNRFVPLKKLTLSKIPTV